MHELIEAQVEARSVLDDEKALRWEVLRERCLTIGVRAGLDEAVLRLEGGRHA